MYWCKHHIFSTAIFNRIMRHDKFELIKKMLRFNDLLFEDSEDSLAKLRGFIEKLGNSFRKIYTPNQNISVDGYLSLRKGRCIFQVSMNATVWRFICFAKIALGVYGHLLFTQVLTLTTPHQQLIYQFNDYSSPYKVVLSLAERFYGKGHCIIVDNLYTSPERLSALYKNNVDCYGTLRKDKGLSKDIWS